MDIYIPNGNDATTGRGILFWIHGGGYVYGDSKLYSGIEQAVNQGNIVVAIQYRLGAMGFFHHYDAATQSTSGGNYGIADAALALKFVHDNAGLMGGDSNRIVINGESAGSWAVMALLLHDSSADLIHGAIAQSGGTINNFLGTMGAMPGASPAINFLIGQVCDAIDDCDSSQDISTQVNQLKNMENAKQLNDVSMEKMGQFGPIPHDGIFYTTNALEKYLNNELYTNFKLFTGFNSYEGSLINVFFDTPTGMSFEVLYGTLSALMNYDEILNVWNNVTGGNEYGLGHYSNTIQAFNQYIRNKQSVTTVDDEQTEFILAQQLGDNAFRYSTVMDAMKYSAAGVETYLYYFDFDTVDVFDPDVPADQLPGLPHAAELYYTFGAYKNPASRQFSNMGDIKNWEYEIGNYLGQKFNDFINSDEPIWENFSSNEAFLVLQHDDNNALASIQYGTADTIKSQQVPLSTLSQNTIYLPRLLKCGVKWSILVLVTQLLSSFLHFPSFKFKSFFNILFFTQKE